MGRRVASPTGFEARQNDPEATQIAVLPADRDVGDPGATPEMGPVPQHLTQPDRVEIALARAVVLASEAGEWSVVAELGRELAARRLARLPPGVPLIAGERAIRQRRL